MTTTDRSDVSWAPRTGEASGDVRHSTAEQVASVVAAATAAAPAVAAAGGVARRAWLDAVADALEADADRLVALADSESALGEARLRGELAKAASNARYYGEVGARGGWRGDVVDLLPPAAPGGGEVELRRVNLPLGPVAVFGASNFPFQFGTAGHDTCSAIAAGCPVVTKAHPAHPRLAAALAAVLVEALAGAGAPDGTFAQVAGFDAGLALVDAPAVRAVAFTGSQRGGMALVERARARAVPIPVFAEMGTVNPAVLTPAGVDRLADVARGFVDSFTLGVGQFCTKPGLLLAPAGSGAPQAVRDEVAAREGGWLLTAGIADAYAAGVQELVEAGAVEVGRGTDPGAGFAAAATVLTAAPDALVPGSRLLAECFGPVALVVEYDGVAQAGELLGRLQPSLAGSVLTGGPADPDVPALVARLAGQVGRVVVDGWPTGVACADAMQHGGPWPATSRPDATSVGGQALARFTRPVAFQGVPPTALPPSAR